MTAKAQLAKWGNSYAVRIPRAVLEKAQVQEGDELEITARAGTITIAPTKRQVTLSDLLAGITPKNRHTEVDWGKPFGREVW